MFTADSHHASGKIFTKGQAYALGNEIFVPTSKTARISFKMTTLAQFIKDVRRPHEKLFILYTQRKAKKSKAYKQKLDRFER